MLYGWMWEVCEGAVMSEWENCEDFVIMCVGIQWRLGGIVWGFIWENCVK